MSLASFLAMFSGMGAVLEPTLVSFDVNVVQPELQTLIASVSSPDLKLLLQALDAGIDSFVQAEIKKLG